MANNITTIANYSDENGNTIQCDASIPCEFVKFRGKNNTLIVDSKANLLNAKFLFNEDNATCIIGKVGRFISSITLFQDCTVSVGDGCTTTNPVDMRAIEKTKIVIGKDCMFSSWNRILGSDAHAIYDVVTGKRVNKTRDIIIDDHVWLCEHAVVLHGSHIKSGSVIGYRSVVKGTIPNNVVAVGSPAKVVKKNIAWERTHIKLLYDKPEEEITRTAQYWSLTEPLPLDPE